MYKDLIERLYQKMSLIRRVEQRLAEIYPTDVIKSPIHLSIGQEAIAVAVCDTLQKDDIVSNSYRCHATYIAKGGNLKSMMAELYGKKTGCAGGKAGSMHLINMQNGILGASAVVGTTIPVAAGFALALKMDRYLMDHQRVVVAFFGDGATEEGCFYETLNFVALHQLPILLVCENNRLAIHTPLEKRWATEKLCERVKTYNISAYKITDPDILMMRHQIENCVLQLRQPQAGPIFIECSTYRWLEHVGPRDDHMDEYRDDNEYFFWKKEDQIARLAAMLNVSTRQRIDDEITANIQDAEEFAKNSPYPADEELYTHVYAS